MTNAAAVRKPDNHVAALSYAREFIATLRDEPMAFPFTNAPFEPLDKSSTHAAARDLEREYLKAVLPKLDLREMMEIVACARKGNDVAHEALLDLLLEYDNRGEQPPTVLAEYRMSVLKDGPPPKRGGWQAIDLTFRNISLAALAWLLRKDFGLNRVSACRLVAQAWRLEMKEQIEIGSIQGILGKHSQIEPIKTNSSR